MRVEIKWHEDMWQEIKDNAMFTIHKSTGKYPDSAWKKKILLAEHSPIRSGRIIVEIYDIPSFVIGHLVRHNVGFTPFVASLRSDRTEYDKVPDRNTPNNVRFDGNFQSFINISRKRLCCQASKETREVWQAVKNEIAKVEPELAECMVRECVYRGFCSEMKPCGFFETELFQDERDRYMDVLMGGIKMEGLNGFTVHELLYKTKSTDDPNVVLMLPNGHRYGARIMKISGDIEKAKLELTVNLERQMNDTEYDWFLSSK